MSTTSKNSTIPTGMRPATVFCARSETFRQSVRQEDIICRYGGEEFVIILPETLQASALDRAEAIRERISQLRVRFRSEALSEITISIGVAAFPHSGANLEEILRAADRAL